MARLTQPLSLLTPVDHLATTHSIETVGARPSGWATFFCALLIIAAAAIAYHNSFTVPFIFDDRNWIVENPTIRDLGHPARIVFPDRANLFGGRPTLSLTLALNYWLAGTDVRGYHAVNLAIHVLAGLALFGVIRRVLLAPSLRSRFGDNATPLAFATALLWVVHPLQTESVTYIIQRGESLAGLFFLMTLYCVIRGAGLHERTGRSAWWWYVAAAVSCVLGVGAKEWVAVAPLVMLLFDRAILSGSFRRAIAERGGLYAALVATWAILAWELVSTNFHNQTTGVGVATFRPLSYFVTQPAVIVHYVGQAFWPNDLSLDYNWLPPHGWLEVAIPGSIVVALLALTVWALIWRPAFGAVGASFFLILAPTSSFLPMADAAAEHRMYLPLAVVLTLAIVGGFYILGRRSDSRKQSALRRAIHWAPIGLSAFAVVALIWTTIERNHDYRSELAIWQDTVEKRPQNWRAHYNLACQLSALDRHAAAIHQYELAVKIAPNYAPANHNLGSELARLGDYDGVITYERRAIQADPNFVEAYVSLGLALEKSGRPREAINNYETAIELNPTCFDALNNIGPLLSRTADTDEAVKRLQQALRLKPESAKAHYNLGAARLRQGKWDEAEREYETTLSIDPAHAGAHADLAGILILRKQYDTAIEHCRRAIVAPESAEIAAFVAVAHSNWGSALQAQGKSLEAIDQWRAAVNSRPGDASLLNHLAWALATSPDGLVRDGSGALVYARRAAELTQGSDPIILATLAAAQAEAGRYPQAVQAAERAIDLAESQHNVPLVESLKNQIQLYESGRAFHEEQ